MSRYSIDRDSLRLLALVVVAGIILIIVVAASFANLSRRSKSVLEEKKMVSEIAQAQSTQTELMNKLYHLTKTKTELDKSSEEVSSNTRISLIVDKLNKYNLKFAKLECGNTGKEEQLSYLTIKFECSGKFQDLMDFIREIENDTYVTRVISLEQLPLSQSGIQQQIRVTANLYGRKS